MNGRGFVSLFPGDRAMLKTIDARAAAVRLFVSYRQPQAPSVRAVLDIRLMNQSMQLVGVGGCAPINSFAIRESRTSPMLSWLLVARSEEHTSELQSLRHLVC